MKNNNKSIKKFQLNKIALSKLQADVIFGGDGTLGASQAANGCNSATRTTIVNDCQLALLFSTKRAGC